MDFLLIPFIFSRAWLFTFADKPIAIAIAARALIACDVLQA
jgi:hypothetical protein